MNNLALARFTPKERQRIEVHTYPGADRDSTHSADVDYAELLPSLFELNAGNFYVAWPAKKTGLAFEDHPPHLKPDQRVFIGMVAPIDPRIETPEEIRDRILEAVRYIPLEQLGTTTTAAFLLSAMTLLPVARRLWRRSGHGLRARRWLRKQSEMDDAA